MKIFGRSRTAIGIDVGSRNIRAGQLCTSNGRCHIVALSLLPRAKLGEQIDRQEILDLKDILRRQGFRGNDVVLAAPEDKLLRASLELPLQVTGAAVAQIIRMELSRLHKVAPDSFELAYWQLSTPKGSKSTAQTIAVGCPHDAANAYLDVFEEAGFNVTSLDVRSAAIARACAGLILPPPAVTSIIDLGWNTMKLLFLWGPTIIYERLINNKFIATLSASLSERFGLTEKLSYQIVQTIGFATDSKASQLDQKSVEVVRRMLRNHFHTMLEELKAPLAYANHQYRDTGIKRLLLIGDGAGISGISQYFEENLGIEAMPAAPTDLAESCSHVLTKAGNPALTVAVGLAKFAGG